MVRRVLPPFVWKELRELGPLWLVCVSAMILCALVPNGALLPMGAPLYALTAVALGAALMGHEYRHRTFEVLLAQPVSRMRLLTAKFFVLVVLLAVLGSSAWALTSPLPTHFGVSATATIILPLMCGLFLAPWLTMLCRNELAGMVFAGAAPAVLWLATDIGAGAYYYGAPDRGAAALVLRGNLFGLGMAITSVAGVLGTIYTFMRLETGSARGNEVRLPWFSRTGPGSTNAPLEPHRVNPYWSLLRKEVGLQELSLWVAAIFAIGSIVLSFAGETVDAAVDFETLRGVLSTFYVGLVLLLIGALTSAEERRLGVLPSQSLLPMGVRKQWFVKVATVLTLAALLAVILPALLDWLRPSRYFTFHMEIWPVFVVLLAVSLYVSSVNSGGMRAFLLSIGALVVGTVLLNLSVIPAQMLERWFFELFRTNNELFRFAEPWKLHHDLRWFPYLLMTGLAAQLLGFAMVNHFSDLTGGRTAWQLLKIAAAVVLCVTLLVAVSGFLSALAWQGRISGTLTAP